MEYLMSLSGPTLYLFIFGAKTVEVTLTTIRVVFINRGERVKASILGFTCALLSITLLGFVFNNISDDPLKIVAYALGYTLGNYLGVTIESKIAIGLSSIKVVVDSKIGDSLADTLRERSFGVTIIDCEGMGNNEKCLLLIQLKRKSIGKAIKTIKKMAPRAYITINDVKSIFGGFIKG